MGTATTLFTGRSVLFSGTRQVLVGAAAAALTYVLGGLLGGSVSD
jgi:VIT1/CCC1 family predicted Fe2+/Mn2+ transporter